MIFTSDNGGERWSYNWPMSDSKGSLHEGGIRVPGAIRWPGVIRPLQQAWSEWNATMLPIPAARGRGRGPG